LPEHFHCLLTLPLGDKDFSVRLRLIKSYVTKHYGGVLEVDREVSASREKITPGGFNRQRVIKQGIYAIDRNPNQNPEATIEMWDKQP